MQPTLFSSVQWTVSGITRHIRDVLESDASLQDVSVQGEISNLSHPASGHVYFTLKDGGASLRSVIWKTGAMRLNFALEDGMAVVAHGRIGVYEVAGQYQLYADQIRPAGEGALYQEFLRLKALLEAQGLFDRERKRPIPILPRRIGIVTSATGAALRDMLNTLRRRLPLAEVIFAASPVQGEEAPPRLVEALAGLNRLKPAPDVILLGRGGGSIEDLWAFNDERVVRALAASAIPVICGVGHETDFTLSDFAADLRAPTPTAAAELATQTTILELQQNVKTLGQQLDVSVSNALLDYHNAIISAAQNLRFGSPERRIQSDRQRLDDLARRAGAGLAHRLALQASQIDGFARRLDALNPLEVLGRGYAVVTRRQDGVIVHKVAQARDGLRIRVSDGEFDAQVSDLRSPSGQASSVEPPLRRRASAKQS